jgi:hypothetical protein
MAGDVYLARRLGHKMHMGAFLGKSFYSILGYWVIDVIPN